MSPVVDLNSPPFYDIHFVNNVILFITSHKNAIIHKDLKYDPLEYVDEEPRGSTQGCANRSIVWKRMGSSFTSNSQSFTVDVIFPNVGTLKSSFENILTGSNVNEPCCIVFDETGLRLEWTNRSKSLQAILDIRHQVRNLKQVAIYRGQQPIKPIKFSFEGFFVL